MSPYTNAATRPLIFGLAIALAILAILAFAQLTPEIKNANSHRGRAAQAMLALMRERWLPA